MKEGAACFGNTKPLTHTHPSCWVKAVGDLLDGFSVSKQRMCQRMCSCVHHGSWSLMALVLSLPSLLQGQPHWWMRGHSAAEPSATRHQKAQFLRPCHNFMCVESNYPKNARNKGIFFPLFNPLASQFCICKTTTIHCCSQKWRCVLYSSWIMQVLCDVPYCS